MKDQHHIMLDELIKNRPDIAKYILEESMEFEKSKKVEDAKLARLRDWLRYLFGVEKYLEFGPPIIDPK